VKDLTPILIWATIIGAAFALLWWRGYLKRISNYVDETREELRKCTWPTWDELKGSTLLVFVTVLMLGVFTVLVDWVSTQLVLLLT
jgi:preprotein translocase subunit SecE